MKILINVLLSRFVWVCVIATIVTLLVLINYPDDKPTVDKDSTFPVSPGEYRGLTIEEYLKLNGMEDVVE